MFTSPAVMKTITLKNVGAGVTADMHFNYMVHFNFRKFSSNCTQYRTIRVYARVATMEYLGVLSPSYHVTAITVNNMHGCLLLFWKCRDLSFQ